MATCTTDSKLSYALLYPIKQLGRPDLISFEAIYRKLYIEIIYCRPRGASRSTINNFFTRHNSKFALKTYI